MKVSLARHSTLEAIEVRRSIHFIAVLALILVSSLATMGAAPLQGGVPPQPYNADYFSGTVFLGSDPAPEPMAPMVPLVHLALMAPVVVDRYLSSL